MKKVFLIGMMCLMALSMQAQRFAVVGFKAGANVSLSSIDGISETFSTYFRPQGYTPVDRLYIDKALAEQRIQRSNITEEQAVAAGRYMNVSKIVVGKVYISFDGGYQVDVVVLDVESGLQVATDGTTVTPGNYRQSIETLAKRLAGKIAIKYGSTVSPSAPTKKQRTGVEVLYGYLKIFPNELGSFQSEPTSVIAQINNQAQHGYNNWRIPTEEELSLLQANNYLGAGKYMSRESKNGIVLLVTNGDDYATVQAEARRREQERIAERERILRERQERRAAKEAETARLKALGLVDLGLPSGTLWKDKNETGGYNNYFTYEQAVNQFGDKLPTEEQLKELRDKCRWSPTGSGYKVTGPNGNSIVLPAAGSRDCDGDVGGVGSYGRYWSSSPSGSEGAWYLGVDSGGVGMGYYNRCDGRSVRLVQD